jgi:invasion protein IalB
MPQLLHRSALLLASIFILTSAGQAFAQQSTTATYGDWVVRCVAETGPPAQKNCDMEQLTQVQGRTGPLSRVAVAHPVKGQPTKMVVQLPVNVSLPAGVKMQLGDKDPGTVTPFLRCVPAGCFTEIELKDDLLKKYRAMTETGKIAFKDAAEHDVVIPLSFKGFGQAFDALSKE